MDSTISTESPSVTSTSSATSSSVAGETVTGKETISETVYSNLEDFTNASVQVDLYQYTVINRLDIITCSLVIIAGLLFFLLVKSTMVTKNK